MVIANTDYCFYHLEEITTNKPLTQKRLSQLLHEYGPHLRVNHRTRTGGTLLVSCCRARYGRECDILKCVQWLVEAPHHAHVNLEALESDSSNLTPLAVAAVRGMFTVVRYLLQKGASTKIKSTGRFRLHTNKKKTVKLVQALPLEFAQGMRNAEQNEGASSRDLKDLDKCIRLLQQYS